MVGVSMPKFLPPWYEDLLVELAEATDAPLTLFPLSDMRPCTMLSSTPEFLSLPRMEEEEAQEAEKEWRKKVFVGEAPGGISFYLDLGDSCVCDSLQNMDLGDSAENSDVAESWVSTELMCSLSKHFPPFLWLCVGSSLDEIVEQIQFYTEAKSEDERPNKSRFFIGTPDMGLPEIHDLEKMLVDTPYCSNPEGEGESIASLPPRAERPEGEIAVALVDSIHSLSRFKIEDMPQLAVLEVEYRTAGHQDLVTMYNEMFGTEFNKDFPIDVVATLHGAPVKTANQIRGEFFDAGGPEEICSGLYVLAFLSDPDLVMDLETFSKHKNVSVRLAVASLAGQTGQDGIIAAMKAKETDREVKALLREF